jgi:hypothetical protein
MLKVWEKVSKEVKTFLQTNNLTEMDEDAIVQFIADLPLADSWTSMPRENYVAKKLVPQFQIIEDYDGKSEKTEEQTTSIDNIPIQTLSPSPMNGLFMSLKVHPSNVMFHFSFRTISPVKPNLKKMAKPSHLKIIYNDYLIAKALLEVFKPQTLIILLF